MSSRTLPSAHIEPQGDEALIRSSTDLGQFVRSIRKQQRLGQLEIAGLANTGNRFIVDLESGKPTLQLQKALEVLDLLGIDLIARRRGARAA
jgi:HTH-type transcriptional regulator/antitoxin HipB